MIMISSKTVLLHANDLMDMQCLLKKSFQPSTVIDYIKPVIKEIVDLHNSMLEHRSVEIQIAINSSKLSE